MIETVCNENEHDKTHMTSTVSQKVEISRDILKKYKGTYEFDGDNPAINSLGRTVKVSVSNNGRLHLNSLPLARDPRESSFRLSPWRNSSWTPTVR